MTELMFGQFSEQLLDPVVNRDHDLPQRDFFARCSRHAGFDRGVHGPNLPLVVDEFRQRDKMLRFERILPGAKRRAWRSIQQTIGFLHQRECILIKAKPNVQPVFLNALTLLRIATTGAFAAKPPSHLIERNIVPVLPTRLIGEVKRRGHCAHATAEDGNFLRFNL